jgi:hypothetical protein
MTKHSARSAAKALGTVPQQLAELDGLTVGQLMQRHRELYGEPTRSRNKVQLRKKLAWKIQSDAEGGLTERSLAKILELGDQIPTQWVRPAPSPSVSAPIPASTRDPRLPPAGTVLTRVHEGRTHKVTVDDSAFTYEGRSYRSLSAVAREITGTAWNGLAFFGLKAPKARAA